MAKQTLMQYRTIEHDEIKKYPEKEQIMSLIFRNAKRKDFFLVLSKIVKEMSSWDTYGSFKQDFLADKKGKLIKTDRVFFNIYDYWGLIHAPRSIRVERWYHPKVALLKKHLRKKWKQESVCKSLPIINVVFKKIEEEELCFNPIPYIEDEEQYFSNLISWKNNFEE